MTQVASGPRTRVQVERERVQSVADMAAKAFAEHRLYPQWIGVPFTGLDRKAAAWTCSRPGDCCYAFTLYTVPGRLIVCGDIGTIVLERTTDMLAWSRSAIDSISYFAEKVTREIETAEFDRDMLLAWVHETDQDVLNGEHSDKFALGWRGELRQEFLDAEDEDEAHRVYYESSLNDGELPDWTNWKHGFLWQREAIKWFLSKVPA